MDLRLFGLLAVIALLANVTAKVQGGFKVLSLGEGIVPLGNSSEGRLAVSEAAAALALALRQTGEEELGLEAVGQLVSSLRGEARRSSDEDDLLSIASRLGAKLNAAATLLNDARRRVEAETEPRSYTQPCPLDSISKRRPSETGPGSARPDGPRVRRQYFLATKDAATDRLCGLAPVRSPLRRLFHAALQPRPKRLAIVIDDGADVGDAELSRAAAVARETVDALGPTDEVAVLLAAAPAGPGGCGDPAVLAPATDRAKKNVFRLLAGLRAGARAVLTDPAAALARAARVFSPMTVPNDMIAYVGPKREIGNSSIVLEIVPNEIVVATCDISLADDSASRENFLVFRSCGTGASRLCAGPGLRFTAMLTAGQIASFLLLGLARGAASEGVMAAPPVWEPVRRDALVPLVLPCGQRGVLALELYLADLAEDVTYFDSLSDRRRAYILDLRGGVVARSSRAGPEIDSPRSRIVDVSLLEPFSEFGAVRDAILTNSTGKETIVPGSSRISYSWRRVEDMFIVCVVSVGNSRRRRAAGGSSARDLQLHRMDLLPPSGASLCRHFRRVSTVERGTLYLGPAAFRSPFRYLRDLEAGDESALTLMRSCMAYLKDETDLLSNPGLRREVRTDVGVLHPMLSYFKRQHIRGALNKYIVRRYAATDRGVMVMFPGSVLESDYEPEGKLWFRRALLSPGRTVFTPPHLDVGGAGYVVTIARALRDPGAARPAIVTAADVTLGFLHKVLADSAPSCSETDIRCFLMDDRGYLLAHPELLEPGGPGPAERHVTHEESLIANDMLNHRGFVQKKRCDDWADGTAQRYYEFNTSLDTVLGNVVHRDHCVRYHIASVPGTNVFVALVNYTCDHGAFCPCSVVDRLCLNCNRMEQTECECPCECPLADDACSPTETPSVPAPPCDFRPERDERKNRLFYNSAVDLKPCFDFQCDSYRSLSACLGVTGCEWCQLAADGDTPLGVPFCSSQTACFGGVLGALTPYGEGALGHASPDDLTAYSAVGPVAGCIVALCLILAVAVYCYRQNLSAAGDRDAYSGASPAPRSETGAVPGPSEDDIRDDRSGHRDKLLPVEGPAPPVSPYRVLTGYRRPDTTGESDHGYSTMTPHEDSEHLAFAPVEPANFEARGGELQLTALPCGKNNILAPVTVHRHMEAA